MTDSIDELIAWCEMQISHLTTANSDIGEHFRAIAEALKAQQWVSVSERLPDEGVPVWGAAIGQFPMMAAIMDDSEGWLWGEVFSFYPSGGKWCCEYEVDDDYSWITHWMPLPQPPKENSGE